MGQLIPAVLSICQIFWRTGPPGKKPLVSVVVHNDIINRKLSTAMKYIRDIDLSISIYGYVDIDIKIKQMRSQAGLFWSKVRFDRFY